MAPTPTGSRGTSTTEMADQRLTLGAGSVLGRYRIERRLGAGAMGEVFLAEDPQIGRRLALKTVKVEEGKPQEIEERKRRLLREARAAGKLLHPNVVTLFDAGEDQGTLYLAFEFVEGMDLADRVAAGPSLTLADALAIVRQAAEALDYAHRQGVIHRDIKPSNLMITSDGRVKVADFGIAKLMDQTSDLTMTGSVVGSPHYLSPEQIRGDELDGRTDIFSLGVLLYEILCNRRPFEADTLTTLVYRILNQDPESIVLRRPDLGPRLERLVRRMLHKEREQRFGSAAELAAEIAACERELSPALLAGRALPEDEPSDATIRLPTEASTGAARGAPSRPAERPSGVGRTETAVRATASQPPKSRVGWVAMAAVALIVVLVVAGLGARRWVSSRDAEKPAVAKETAPKTADSNPPLARPLAQPETRREAKPESEPVREEVLREEVPALAIESQPESGAPDPATLLSPVEQPIVGRAAEIVPAGPLLERRSELERPPFVAPPAARDEPRPVTPPFASVAAEPAPAAEDSETAELSDPQNLRQAVVARLPVAREMATGMSLSFEIQPKEIAERLVVRLDRIVIGRAVDYNAKKRDGRAYTIAEPGLHILSFLIDGAEVYRMRIDAQPLRPAPTSIAVNLQQAAQRGRRPDGRR